MLSRRVIVLTLSMGAVALWVVTQQTQRSEAPATQSLHTSEYSWQMFNSTTWQYDKLEKAPGPTIRSQTLFHNEDTQTSDFTQPRIILAQPDQTIFIQSQRGQSRLNNEIDLKQNVAIWQYDAPYFSLQPQNQNSTLKTEFITYNANKKTLRTHERVSIEQTNTYIEGTGLRADIERKRYRLLDDVDTHYRPAE